MVGRTGRVLTLLMGASLALGAMLRCSLEPGGVGGGGVGHGLCRGCCGGHADPRDRGGQVQRRHGPHRTPRRRRLEPGPLRGPDRHVRDRGRHPRRLHRERARGRRLRADLPVARPQGLRLHHRDVLRVHGPDGDRRHRVPRPDVPPPDRVQEQRQELRQLLRRDGGLQVPRRHARRLAREGGRQPEDRLHGHLPDPRGAPARQRDHARREADLPRVHDGRRVHQHLARPDQGEGRRHRAVRRRARRSCSRAPTPVPSPTSPRRRASGASPTTTRPPARWTPASPPRTGSGDRSTAGSRSR